MDFLKGEVLLIDKPLEWTSFDVVNKLRYHIKHYLKVKKVKVGHAGTLDPLATGLLIICTGKMTKSIEQFQAQDKEYTGIIELGRETPSYDLETETSKTHDITHISESMIRETAQSFIGIQQQIPPIFSAKKVNGKRAYDFARKDEEVKLKAKEITISDFEITKIEFPYIHFRIACSKGTYIRSIAHDFGQKLNNGACLIGLRRTKIGDFSVDKAISIEAFIDKIEQLKTQ